MFVHRGGGGGGRARLDGSDGLEVLGDEKKRRRKTDGEGGGQEGIMSRDARPQMKK